MAGSGGDESTSPRPRRGRPRSASLAQRRRTELMTAAYRIFADHGYERASVSEIAAQAGMGQGTLYRYVEGKRELLDMVFDRCIDQLVAVLDFDSVIDAVESADPGRSEAAVIALGNRLFPLVEERPELLTLVTVRAGTVDDELRYRIDGLYRSCDAIVGHTVADAHALGWVQTRTDVPERETMLLARLFAALILPGLALQCDRDTRPVVSGDYARTAVAIAERGIVSAEARR